MPMRRRETEADWITARVLSFIVKTGPMAPLSSASPTAAAPDCYRCATACSKSESVAKRIGTHLLPCISPSTAGCLLPGCASSDTSGPLEGGPSVPGTTARTKPAVERRGMREV